jgi:hypothetical protein
MNVSAVYEDTSSRAGSRRWCFNVREGEQVRVFRHHTRAAAEAARAQWPTELVKCGSHRAREKMLKLVPEGRALAYFSMRRDIGTGGVYRIPAAYLVQARAITGVSGFREGDDLMRCWPSQSMRELVSR